MDFNATMSVETAIWNLTNNTFLEPMPEWKKKLFVFHKIMLASLLVIIMIAMGCNMSLGEVLKHFKKPIGFAIGIVGQFILLPLMAFGAANALSFQPEHAIGLLIMCTCPGGTVSNIFSYWVDGDVSLSVSMTTVSTVISFGMMPFNLWVYTRWWSLGGATIPYVNIVITLVSILVPVAVGMLIKWRSDKAARWISVIGSVAGLVCIVATVIMLGILFPFVFRVSWRIAVVGFCLPPIAFLASYGVALISRRPAKICRTIGIETTIQNMPMATSVMTLSYGPEMAAMMLTPSLVYGPMMFIEGCIYCGIFKIVRSARMKAKYKAASQDAGEEAEEATLDREQAVVGRTDIQQELSSV